MTTQSLNPSPELDFNTPAAQRLRKYRAFKDKFASVGIAVGGISVIIAILLIFFYLLYEVAPLFQSAKIEPWEKDGKVAAPYEVPAGGKTLYLGIEEQAQVAFRVSEAGQLVFFKADSGEIIKSEDLNLPEGVSITKVAPAGPQSHIFAIGLSNGQVFVYQHKYKSTYPDGVRVITPSIVTPIGSDAIQLGNGPIEHLTLNGGESGWFVIGGSKGEQQQIATISLEENFLTGEVEANTDVSLFPKTKEPIAFIKAMPDRRWVLVGTTKGNVEVYRVADDELELSQTVKATNGKIVAFDLLLGGNSLLIGDSAGVLSQWFLVRDENNDWQLTRIRDFETEGKAAAELLMEQRRKGFVTIDADNTLRYYSTTANRVSLEENISKQAVDIAALAPRSNALLVERDGQYAYWQVHNEHPEISWSALWSKVWYEGYEEPDYIWQSSASTNDFEPKYSLMPLAFGTLKAAFYAMLLATPLAICGAIYTAYFMVPAMRRKVKPFIELMEALPTVILGFLAGLWLAPFMESNLAGIFTTLVFVPISVLLFAYFWTQAPARIRYLLPEGWDAALLVPVIILATMLSLNVAGGIEELMFGGDMPHWLATEVGITYDQRNAMVVGIAMGFAVIPTIFSITEDAIFAVPKHLSYGSLALGATPWQTLSRVVLPTASPGIFSAVMIGMGRAVGETMIVLMATGNTPIMDMNIFEGMRTLAANIAVEMPESEVGSSHFRILFLAAFVLFLFTFMVNTLAESIRHHLRKKYGSL